MRVRLPRATFANVTSLLALFVALGGTAYAAVSLPAGSVGTAQLQKGAVTSGKILDGTLKVQDFKDGTLQQGPAGPRGAAGAAGAAGPAGTIKATTTVVTSNTSIPGTSTGYATATCPTGQQAIGGGTDTDNVGLMYMMASSPIIDGTTLDGVTDGQHGPATGWRVFVRNGDAVPRGIKVVAICAPIG